jgi:predicted GIY-YIG superfamily endonuclease
MIYNGVIYCAVSPSGKKYYGFTYDLKRRIYIHKRNSSTKKNVFYSAITKYGFENFSWIIVESFQNEDKTYLREILRKRERFWIDKELTYLSEYGYNMTRGGDGGDTFSGLSDERKINIINKKKINYSGSGNPMYGKKVYDIWVEKYGVDIANDKLKQRKEKSSKSQTGKKRPHSEETKEKIRNKLLGVKLPEERRKKLLGNTNASGKRSEESKEKMRKPKSSEHIEKIKQSKINKKLLGR